MSPSFPDVRWQAGSVRRMNVTSRTRTWPTGSVLRAANGPFSDMPGAAPEVEIVARAPEVEIVGAAAVGAEVESALAPGMNVMKTFDPPLEALAGRELTGVRRIGKMPVVEFGDLALLIHLMSAGRLRVFDKRASLKTAPRGSWCGSRTAASCGCASSGPSSGPGRSCCRPTRSPRTRWWRRWGPKPGPLPRSRSFAAAIDKPRHLHPLLRHQKDIAGIGRSWVDEILWEARLSPFKKGSELEREEVERLHAALHVLGDAIDHYEETIGAEVPDKVPMPLKVHKREGEPCPRCGTTIEAVFFSEHQTNYCPEEQTGGRVLKDRRLSKLLK